MLQFAGNAFSFVTRDDDDDDEPPNERDISTQYTKTTWCVGNEIKTLEYKDYYYSKHN